MKRFEYVISDKLGIHARPAGELVKIAQKVESKILIKHGEKEVDAIKLLAIMALGVKCGEKLVFEIEGPDEDTAYEKIKSFMESSL